MLQRSCWKIPRSAMTVVDEDGNDRPAFVDLVAYDETTQYVYAMAAHWERPDLVDAGATRESLINPTSRKRFLRTTVRRAAADPADPDVVLRVKASAVRQSDHVLEADEPVVLFAADVADEVVGMEAMQEAVQRIAKENAPDPDPDPPEAPAPEGP